MFKRSMALLFSLVVVTSLYVAAVYHVVTLEYGALLSFDSWDTLKADVLALDWETVSILSQAAYEDRPELFHLLAGISVFTLLNIFFILVFGKRAKKQPVSSAADNAKKPVELLPVAEISYDVISESHNEPPVDPSSDCASSSWIANSSDALIERLKKDLVIAEQSLEAANKSKSQFVANMSHELRTPMNGILGMTELLLDSGLDSAQMRFADSVRRSAESLLGVINDLLDFSYMEAGDLTLENATFNFREIIEDVCELHAELAQRKGLELVCHIERDMKDFVVGDANRVRQLITNLISNSVKFTREGEVVIRVKPLDSDDGKHRFKIDVLDTGIGITPEAQARIFDSFNMADDSSSREFEGSGLGLFITYQLVKKMNGTIALRSRMDEGSHFTVTLEFESATGIESTSASHCSLEGAKVLIVDDNETNRTILFHQLKSWGAEPYPVDSGHSALSVLKDSQHTRTAFDVAILDLHMPVMDGVELSRIIQADPELAGLKRMMLTSAALDLSVGQLAEVGISQHISKPARQAQLFDALSALVPHLVRGGTRQSVSQTQRNYAPLGYRVLLAEDNLINQDVASGMLQNFGCTVDIVNNGRAALEACERSKYDVILMDCAMSVLDGYEATRKLRSGVSANAATPVVALTAHVQEEDRQKCIDCGMNDFLSKPVKQDRLYRALKVAVVGDATELEGQSASSSGSVQSNVNTAGTEHQVPRLQSVESIALNNAAQSSAESNAAQDQESDQDKTQKILTVVAGTDATQVIKKQIDQVAANEAENVSSSTDASTPAEDAPAMTEINEQAIANIRRLQRPGKPDIVNKVINVYFEKSPSLIKDIVDGLSTSDLIKVKEAAHSLKSSSAYVGADGLSEMCKKIELSAAGGDLSDVASQIGNLEADYAAIAATLSVHLSDAA